MIPGGGAITEYAVGTGPAGGTSIVGSQPANNASANLPPADTRAKRQLGAVFVAPNLLLTTLAVASVVLRGPLIVNQAQPTRGLEPQPIPNLLVTTLATPAALPAGDSALASAPYARSVLASTAQGSPLALLSAPAGEKPRFVSPFVSTPRNASQPADTSRGTPAPLIAPVQTKPPFVAPFVGTPRNAFQPPDTSRGTPKPLYQDTSFAPTQLTENIPALFRPAINPDTSQGSRALYLTPPTPPAEELVRPPLFQLPKRIDWQPLDTTRGTFAALIPAAQKPFAPAPQVYVDRVSWQPLDTSRSTFAGLFPAPFTPAGHLVPPVPRWQPADTSRGAFPALLPVQAPFFTYQHQQPQRAVDVADTSRGLNLPLQTFVQSPFAPVQHSAPVANVSQPADTSHGTPAPLLALLFVKPFVQSDWPAPIESRHRWLPQETFWGQDPDRIPPAPPPPPPVDEAKPGATIGDPYVRALLEQQAREFEQREQAEADARVLRKRLEIERSESLRAEPDSAQDAVEPAVDTTKSSGQAAAPRGPAQDEGATEIAARVSAVEQALAAQEADRAAKLALIEQTAVLVGVQIDLGQIQDDDDLDAILAVLLLC